MRIFRTAETTARAADAKSFVGPAMTRLLASSDEGASVHVYRVEFGDGARTNWHSHSGAQWLFVIEGRIRIQREGEPAADASDGDAIVIPPGEKHWHGATPGSRGVHIAVNIDAKTEWLEAVTDAQYRGR
jgi:quercetin dioxygenase-like cupin family protein